ncbi:MAG TPA: SMC-Scp complex subunit ScpB [Woeseiaceae bacterium]|nr:SMC-Scp complex subunit ScpB [Woeseiaceae bacterium]
MDQNEIKYFVEAALLAAGRPLSIDQLQNLFDRNSVPERTQIREAISGLQEDYEERGLAISEVASGFRTQIKASMADRLQKLWEERPPRYSRAFFETLALIAYRQPMTRGEIEEIRGVAVSANIMRSLLERDWIRVVGHRDVPGRPAMFGTTRHFLDYFGLKKLDDLPPLADLADWETLRVQLNLPEVSDEEAEPETAEIADLPVLLYPQSYQADDEAGAASPGEDEASAEDIADAAATAGFEAIPPTRWPGPVEILRVVPGDDIEDPAEDEAGKVLKDRDALISRR